MMIPSMPQHIIKSLIIEADLPLLRAKKVLGDRLVWLGNPSNKAKTCWSLDGGKTHATDEEIRIAVGMPTADDVKTTGRCKWKIVP